MPEWHHYSKVKLGLWISVLRDKEELHLRANKKKSGRYREVPPLHTEMVSWVGYVQVRAEFIFTISLTFSRTLKNFSSSCQRGEVQMGMFLLIGKKKGDSLSFIFLVFRRAYISKQNCSKWERRVFLRKVLKAIKNFPSKLVIFLQIIWGEFFFFNETGIPLKKKSHQFSLSPIFHFC